MCPGGRKTALFYSDMKCIKIEAGQASNKFCVKPVPPLLLFQLDLEIALLPVGIRQEGFNQGIESFRLFQVRGVPGVRDNLHRSAP
jgi:hypothetical protein